MDRRDFLKLGGMMLGAAGTMGLPSSVRATMNSEYERLCHNKWLIFDEK